MLLHDRGGDESPKNAAERAGARPSSAFYIPISYLLYPTVSRQAGYPACAARFPHDRLAIRPMDFSSSSTSTKPASLQSSSKGTLALMRIKYCS